MTEALAADTDVVSRLRERSIEMRLANLELVEVAGSGHYGPSFSCMEILVSLYYGFLRVRPGEPQWPGRDRFVLGKGHACSALYPILADLGFFPESTLGTFTRLGSPLGDHPDMRKIPGIDFSSGSLGHGLSIGTGMADGVRLAGRDSRVVVLLGDGELNEGQVWEAAAYASHRGLANLLAIVDANRVSVDGFTRDLLDFEPIDGRFAAFGWHAERVDGHSHADLLEAYRAFDERRAADPDGPPTVLVADTVAGRGVDFIEGMAEWHVGYLGGVDRDRAVASIRRMFHREGH
ncbi:transketolase [Dactylosporangium matsuzakiense]|uniref:Transketolase, N-terminal subunit n=1 Tax=Dactylosporangium matsuzakiense TaxID=53360 RepID=A0A9W6NT83_9ACTN|nr:transketolase [Dactylosporangium matsuzakiense]UWZ42396.1 transketolase [Dactylosporangium matsuzakiense]GLL07932.1 transketolase, N-terminal subunit [Dactylosporangium matsuzakiense]